MKLRIIRMELIEFVTTVLCMLFLGLLLGNVWGSRAVRTTIEKTNIATMPEVKADMKSMTKEVDELQSQMDKIFGIAKPEIGVE